MSRISIPVEKFDIRRAQQEGMTIAEAAQELGISYDAARNRAYRANVKLAVQREVSFEQKALEMKPVDAVNYLLGVVHSLLMVHPDQPRFAFDLTPMQERLLAALDDHRGMVVSKESLFEAIYFDRIEDDRPESMKIVDVQVSKIRKLLPDGFGSIDCVWGVGYRLKDAGS